MDLTQTISEFIAYIDGLEAGDLTPSDRATLCTLLEELKAANLKALTSIGAALAARHSYRK
jgi:hypothetical protein